jgi:hypothetical protein
MHTRTRRDPGALTGLLSGVSFVGAIVGAMKLAKGPFPRPGTDGDGIRDYYRESARAARFSAAGQLVSVLSLARFTASAVRLAEHSRHPGVLRPAVLVGGGLSVASLTAAALTHASLTVPADRDPATWERTSRGIFVAGGPVHGVAYGVFTGALTAAARDAGIIGPGLVRTGFVSAAASVLSPAYFRWENAGWLIPIGRFTGYAVTGVVGTRLARGVAAS